MLKVYSRFLAFVLVVNLLALQIAVQGEQKSCDLCEKLDSEFKKGEEKFESLCKKAEDIVTIGGGPCPPTPASGIQVVVSKPTSDNNGVTIAKCDVGFILINCRCTHEDETCQGVTVNGNKRFCKARNVKDSGTLVRAIATCVPVGSGFTIVREPGKDDEPTVTCGPDKRIVDCWIENRSEDFIRTSINLDGSECKSTANCGTGNEGCFLSALCYNK